jgi:phage terminase large subunit-like protein
VNAPLVIGEEKLDLSTVVQLAAVDSSFFGHTFFPKTFRQKGASFHREMWKALEDPTHRYVAMKCFRDSAKTTILRTYAAKRIAYGISKTILYISANEGHAVRSVQWLRMQVEKNTTFATTFGLQKGRKWQENEAEIYRATEDETVWIFGAGITSASLRGINFEDYRPDLIILDDAINDENAITDEQREKIFDLISGAIKRSLAPASEEPNAKMVLLNTPIHPDDALARIEKDEEWKTISFSCWTPDTQGLAVEHQESSWPERYPSELRRKEKLAAINSNTYSKFARELECQLVTQENTAFKPEWIKFFEEEDLPHGSTIVIIDPVPPPSDRQLSKNLAGKDYEAIVVLRRAAGSYYVVDYRRNRGHEPNWTVATTCELAFRYKAMRIVVEAIAYQRTIEYLLRQEMSRRGIYWAIVPVTDKRKKYNRIVSTLAGPLSQGRLFIRESMSELRAEISLYPNTSHEDLLDAVAMGVFNLSNALIDLDESEYMEVDESHIPDLPSLMRCP